MQMNCCWDNLPLKYTHMYYHNKLTNCKCCNNNHPHHHHHHHRKSQHHPHHHCDHPRHKKNQQESHRRHDCSCGHNSSSAGDCDCRFVPSLVSPCSTYVSLHIWMWLGVRLVGQCDGGNVMWPQSPLFIFDWSVELIFCVHPPWSTQPSFL